MDVVANLPETIPFLSAQMALPSSFFQVFIVLGMYNFKTKSKAKACKNVHNHLRSATASFKMLSIFSLIAGGGLVPLSN